MLTIDPEAVFYIMVKARELGVKVAGEELEDGSNPTDDADVGVLEESADDPTYQELVSALDSLNEDEMDELVALVWLGRGDFTRDEWEDGLAEARETREDRAPDHLIGIPLLSDYIEEGMAQLGYSMEDYEIGRL